MISGIWRWMCACVVLCVVQVVDGQQLDAPRAVRMDGVAAYVNGEPITLSEVIRTSRELQAMLLQPDVDRERLNALYTEALDGVIAAKLIVADYEAQKRLSIPDAAIDERLEMIVEEQFNGDRIALAEALTREGMSMEGWREQIREGIIVQAMRSQNVDRHVRVSPSQVKAAFSERKDALARPGRVKVKMIVCGGAEGEETVQEASRRIADGEAFEEVAKALSTGVYASKGGDRGWMDLPDLREELRAAIHGLEAGQVTEPVEAGGKYYLLQVDGLEAGQPVVFEEVAAQLERELRTQVGHELFLEWVGALRQGGYVRVAEEAPF